VSWRGVARRSLPFVVTAASGFILAYLVVAIFVFPKSILPTETRVPDVVGVTYDEAASRLKRDGFEVATRERRYHASAPEGMVLAQRPRAGATEAKGAKVELDVSRGQRTGEVPPLAGLTVEEARDELAEAGMEMGGVTERESDAERGEVVGSEPREGTSVPLPATVEVYVSGGPREVEVPEVVGNEEGSARSTLQQAGFRVRVGVDSFSTMPLGTVVSQSPAAGSRAPRGAVVSLTVSVSPSP
jgi:serine/threonine-protein kinase